ncbi:phosphodiesterase [Enterovibrio calviensis]|uniref:phosphodiesterase n=1 Tax=Enterovibrio calviensis TaxID=91359 RepID=UPI000489F5E8|nr:phosphodiesterase [Enterovibrio calviensis]
MTRIIQITDIHLTVPPTKVSGQLNTFALFEQAIDKIEQDLPLFGDVDAVIATGDITDYGDEESYQLFKTQIERLNLPYLVIPGNHDSRDAMLTSFPQLAGGTEHGELNWVETFSAFDVIGLDSIIPNQGGGALSDSTLQFLKRALASNPNKPALIALHHPPFESGIHFMDNIGLKGADTLSELLNHTSREVRVICGHLHNSIVCSLGNTTVLSSPAVASSFMTDHRPNAPAGFTKKPGGYMLHEWINGFRSSYLSLSTNGDLYPF